MPCPAVFAGSGKNLNFLQGDTDPDRGRARQIWRAQNLIVAKGIGEISIPSAGEPWFVLADVCRVLEVGNPRQAAARLDDDEKSSISASVISNDGGSDPTIINESGLYSLILTSRKPAAISPADIPAWGRAHKLLRFPPLSRKTLSSQAVDGIGISGLRAENRTFSTAADVG